MPADHFEIRTFKAPGLLSPVAHDLALAAEGFRVHLEGTALRVLVPLSGLRVLGKVVAGRVEPISARDAAEIESTMRAKVLRVDVDESAVFTGSVGLDSVSGQLRLAGRTAPLVVPLRRSGPRVLGDVELVPSRWGIQPYTALFGALRLQDRVGIHFDLPWPEPPTG